MHTYIKRNVEKLLPKYLKGFPVVGITGPRQSGKSTMLRRLLKDEYRYVTFDDYKIVDFFYRDPEKFMKTYSDRVIFGEVQKVPEIFNYIKIAVDNDRQNYGKFILTGSSRFSFMRKITESLAGRIGLLTLLPFAHNELPQNLTESPLYDGAFPELVLQKYSLKEEWFAAYLETYIEKDIQLIYDIGNMRDFRRLISLLAANVSNVLNMSRFANDLGVAVSTIKKWISVLEASYMIFLLPPYTKNHRKSVIKSPKVYFYDNGLVTYLCGISSREQFEQGPMAGQLFENYIISEMQKHYVNNPYKNVLSFYKVQRGIEIDLILDEPSKRTLIEIKNSATFKTQMVHAMEQFAEDTDTGFLIYTGDDFPYAGQIDIVNYHNFLSSL